MATGRIHAVLQHLHAGSLLPAVAEQSDGQLLEQFVARREQAAFTALVRRHGPMVFGVCRRLLSHHDAEDAFQATFLVLARKAAGLRHGLLAGWLHGVAYRTALKARGIRDRRAARERQVAELPEPAAAAPAPWSDLGPLLDRELDRLPEKLRAAVLLCDVQGHSRAAAARQLGWPEGTVAGRLARARALLARRLTRKGVTLSAAGLAAALATGAEASLPAALVTSTLRSTTLSAAAPLAVAALTEGVLHAMLMTKLKVAAVVLLVVAVAGAGAGGLVYSGARAEPAKDSKAAEGDRKARAKKPLTDKEKLRALELQRDKMQAELDLLRARLEQERARALAIQQEALAQRARVEVVKDRLEQQLRQTVQAIRVAANKERALAAQLEAERSLNADLRRQLELERKESDRLRAVVEQLKKAAEAKKH